MNRDLKEYARKGRQRLGNDAGYDMHAAEMYSVHDRIKDGDIFDAIADVYYAGFEAGARHEKKRLSRTANTKKPSVTLN